MKLLQTWPPTSSGVILFMLASSSSLLANAFSPRAVKGVGGLSRQTKPLSLLLRESRSAVHKMKRDKMQKKKKNNNVETKCWKIGGNK